MWYSDRRLERIFWLTNTFDLATLLAYDQEGFQLIDKNVWCRTHNLVPIVHFSIPTRENEPNCYYIPSTILLLCATPLCSTHQTLMQPLWEDPQERDEFLLVPVLTYVRNVIQFTTRKLGQPRNIYQTRE